MRTRNNRSLENRLKAIKLRGAKYVAPYDYTTASPSNGKIALGLIENPNRGSKDGAPYMESYIKAKPYLSASADGSPFVETDENTEFITNSDIAYHAIFTSPQILDTIKNDYGTAEAENYAISAATNYCESLMLVTLAESKQTIYMVRSVFTRLYRLFLGLYKNVKKRNVREIYNELSNAWLEYRYGWRPLWGDIQALTKVLTIDRLRGIFSAYGTDHFIDINRRFDIPTRTIKKYDQEYTYSGSVLLTSVSMKVGFNYLNQPDDPNASYLAMLGLDAESILSTGYDLIPFSFILDMFGNFSEWIKIHSRPIAFKPFNGYATFELRGEMSLDSSTGSTFTRKPYRMRRSSAHDRLSFPIDEGVNDYYSFGEYQEYDQVTGEYYARKEAYHSVEFFPFSSNFSFVVGVTSENSIVGGIQTVWNIPYTTGSKEIGPSKGDISVSPKSIGINSQGEYLFNWWLLRAYELDIPVEDDFKQVRVYQRCRHEGFLKQNCVSMTPAEAIQRCHNIVQLYIDSKNKRRYNDGSKFARGVDLCWNSWSAFCKRHGTYPVVKPVLTGTPYRNWPAPYTEGNMTLSHWENSDDYDAIISGDIQLYEYFPNSESAPVLEPQPQTTFPFTACIREEKDDFSFTFTYDCDLSDGQIADLSIFGERLISAIRKK